MSKDYRHCRAGLPDLVVWNTSNNSYKVGPLPILLLWRKIFMQYKMWFFFFFLFFTISSWWRWRAPMTDSLRSNRSGWMSSTNWELMWKCVTWLPLEPEELVWIKNDRKQLIIKTAAKQEWTKLSLISEEWLWDLSDLFKSVLLYVNVCYCMLKQFCINKSHAIPSKQMFLVVGSNAAKWNFNHPSHFHTVLHTAH